MSLTRITRKALEKSTINTRTQQKLNALEHRYDSIHRDLKSGNILLTLEKGSLRAKVADFGTSRFVSTKMSNTITNDSKDSDSSTTRSPLQDTMSAESDTRVTMTSSEGT